MTTASFSPASPGSLGVSPETATRLRDMIDDLTIALEATKLAVDAAKEASYRISAGPSEPAKVLEGWRANTLLVHQAFDHLYYEVRHAASMIRPLAGLDEPMEALPD